MKRPEFPPALSLGLLLLTLLLAHPFTATAAPEGLKFGPAEPFSFDRLIEKARGLAGQPYVPPPQPLPAVVQQIDYEAWGNIRYRPESALFAKGPELYPATFFHLGQFFQKSVYMHTVENGQARKILYSNDYFSMPKDSIARKLPDGSGFAGFRLQESRNREDWRTQDWVA